MRRSMLMAAIAGLLSGLRAEVVDTKPSIIWFDDMANWGIPTIRRTCPKTVSAAALKRAAKKRRNMRARSKK